MVPRYLRLVIAVLSVAVLTATPLRTTADTTEHESSIRLVVDSGISGVNTDADPNHAVYLGFVGVPVKMHIISTIGWASWNTNGGPMTLVRNEVPNPIYAYFCATSDPCDMNAYGIQYSAETGEIWGTPTASFQVAILAAVREKTANGTQLYNGDGFWWTTFIKDSKGIYWSVMDSNPAKAGTGTILIVNKPDLDKQVHLRCTLTPAGEMFLNLDYDLGRVEVLSNTGAIGGFFKIDPSSSILGWAGYPYSGVTLDRASGALNATYQYPQNGVAQVSGQCVKRSNSTLF